MASGHSIGQFLFVFKGLDTRMESGAKAISLGKNAHHEYHHPRWTRSATEQIPMSHYFGLQETRNERRSVPPVHDQRLGSHD
jgi:hypothetical protein